MILGGGGGGGGMAGYIMEAIRACWNCAIGAASSLCWMAPYVPDPITGRIRPAAAAASVPDISASNLWLTF